MLRPASTLRSSLLRAAFVAAAMTSCAVLPPPLLADDAQDRKIQDLEKRVAALEARIRELLSARETAGGADAAELQRRIDLLAAELDKLKMGAAASGRPLESVHGMGPAASRVYGVTHGVSIGGYGEVLYQNPSARRDDGEPSGAKDTFDTLRGVLYFGYKFTDRIVFNSELEVEHASTEDGGEAAMEFAYLDFEATPAVNVRTGLVLVPAGFINELHEPPVFLGARRPEVEKLIIPTTWRENGVGVVGEKGPFAYRGYVLAGFDSAGFSPDEALAEGKQEGAGSLAEDLAVAVRADYTGVPGLLAGGFWYRGDSSQGREAPVGFTVDPNGAPVTPPTRPFGARVTLWDLHAGYKGRGLDLRALYAEGHLDDAAAVNDANGLDGMDSVGSRFHGWYVQAGYDLLSFRRREGGPALIPYIRYESLDTQDRVPGRAPLDRNPDPGVNPLPFARNPANDMTITTWGVAWKPIGDVSVKLDYANVANAAGTGVNQYSFAVGYLF